MIIMALMYSMVFVSCGEDNDSPGIPGTEEGGEGGGSSSVTTESQKQQLETTANELMAKINYLDFKNVADVLNSVDNDRDDQSAVEDWFEACVDACEQPGSTSDYIMSLYRASNFYGQFELRNGVWEKTGTGNSLQFRFNDNKNRQCVFTVSCSGKETKVHHELFDYEDYYYSYGYRYVEEYENAFMVPQYINITLTQNGTQIAGANISTTLNIRDANGEANLSTDIISVTTTLNVSNYSIIVERADFSGGSNATASASAKFMKGAETLITTSMQATGNTSDEDNIKGGNVTAITDVLGQVQVKCNISDIERLRRQLEIADDCYDSENDFKQCIEQANTVIDAKLYFNGSSASSAYLELYPFPEYSWNGYEEWGYEPVIMFPDGSAYNTVSDYFDEDFFRDVIDRFNSLIDDFDSLIE